MAGRGASFRRSIIRGGYRQSARFDSIVSWFSLPLRQMLEDTTMSLSEQSSERKLRIPAPSETALLATIAICFLVLHILAATMSTSARQNDAGTVPEPPGLSSGD
jgi:hypothetical protein